jgi:phosphonate degradation associated HDIG domain protein
MKTVDDVLELFREHGHSEYGGEAVTQAEHALQCAALAENESAAPELIAAALLHDVGHLLHNLPDDAPDQGIDDAHEDSGYHYLSQMFPESVIMPIKLHVASKRYLCTTDPNYLQKLSEPSLISLRLQGGPMSEPEVLEFERHPYFKQALRLRCWDDIGKVPGLPTPSIEHFAGYLRQVAFS